MALETEQRLEAVRQFARAGFEFGANAWADFLDGLLESNRYESMVIFNVQRSSFYLDRAEAVIRCEREDGTSERLDLSCLDWVESGEGLYLRGDMRDIIWSVLQEQNTNTSQDG